VANYPGGVTSTSLEKCVTSFTTQKPPALTDLSATFNDASTIELSWANAPQASEYSIYKNTSGGAYSLNTVLPSSPFIDTQTSLTEPTCYKVPYNDACNNSSENDIEACPVFLSGTVSGDNQVSLSWTPYLGWQAGVSGYRLEKYSQSGARLRVYPVTLTTTFLDDENDLTNQLTYYKVFAIPTDPSLPTVNSNMLEIIRRPNLFYPTSFTPDKQGPTENEVFKVFGQYVASFEMEIFNRWGELMFTTTDFENGWDGTYRGVDQPDGTYAFVATITDYAGRSSNRSGSIVLLRTK
jgi:gliding motility-associated-like protein